MPGHANAGSRPPQARWGPVACRDGFRAGIMLAADFRRLCCEIEVEACVNEVEASSVFCEIQRWSEP